MKRHLIAGRFGTDDDYHFQTDVDEVGTYLDLVASERRLDFGIGRALEDLFELNVWPSEIGLDLLVLAAHVFAADTRISRRIDSQDGWTRELRLIVPVSDPERWKSATNTLETMLRFLTGDIWAVAFRPRPARFAQVVLPRPANDTEINTFDCLSLFSGGLDSLIGAIDALESGRSPLLVSHASEGATSDAQNTLFDALHQTYQGRTLGRLRLWMSFPSDLVPDTGSEPTTRGRSFLFFALGAFAGSGLTGEFTLRVPENGLIALNIPLDKVRLGALSTRTTHPYYIARWNDLLRLIGIPARIENPYWQQTKGEMVRHCANQALIHQLAASSLSCASPSKGRWLGHAIQHCGVCLPCLIRRAALLKGFGPGQDLTTYTLANLTAHSLSTRRAEGKQVRSFQVAIDRLAANPDLANILIHKPGPLSDEPHRWTDLANVYRRGMDELSRLLVGVRTAP